MATVISAAARAPTSPALRRARMHRVVRQLHLWIGAWGALASVLYGTSGFMQNHRNILRIPQPEATEVSHQEIPVPEQARTSPDALRAWLRETQHVKLEQRGPQGRGGEGHGGDHNASPLGRNSSSQWNFQNSNVRTTVQAEYTPGADTVELRTTVQPVMGILSRLHKGNGTGVAWILLSDSFALSMVALGISGLIMWGRTRTLRQMVFSVFGAAAVVFLLIAGSAIL